MNYNLLIFLFILILIIAIVSLIFIDLNKKQIPIENQSIENFNSRRDLDAYPKYISISNSSEESFNGIYSYNDGYNTNLNKHRYTKKTIPKIMFVNQIHRSKFGKFENQKYQLREVIVIGKTNIFITHIVSKLMTTIRLIIL